MESNPLHRRSVLRKHRKRLVTLLVVIGLLSLVIGALIELAAIMQLEHQRHRFVQLGFYFLGTGVFFLAINYLVFILPDQIADRRSGVASRRRAVAKAYQRPAKPSPGPVSRPQNDGSILMIVLVLLGIIAAVSLHAIVTSRGALKSASAQLDIGLLRLAAIDSARSAMQQLADDPDLDIDHLAEPWAQSQEYVDPSGTTRMIRITDANRRFDLNNLAVTMTAQPLPVSEVLANIMIQTGDFRPGQRIEALRDFIDADEAGPWESFYYQQQDPPSVCPNHILYGWSDLLLVDGWEASQLEPKPVLQTRTLFDHELADSITVIPAPRARIIPINLNTADSGTLQGLFGVGREGVVERILNRRKETPFRTTTFLSDLLGATEYANASPYLDVKSDYFHVETTAYREGRSARLNLLARRQNDGSVQALQAMF